MVGAAPEQVIFTSGCTEANNLALSGLPAATILMTSAIEHDSVLAAAPEARRLPVDGNGVILMDALEAALTAAPAPTLVSIMLANNETGVIQPIAEIAERVHARGGILHSDAVQAAGKVPVDIRTLGIDFLSLSAHKIGGPTGIGALVVPMDADISPQLRGGGQERRRRAGTENVLGIAGFGAAAAAAAGEAADQIRLRALQQSLETKIRTAVPTSQVHACGVARLSNTSCIGLPGVRSEIQVINLDLAGIAVSAGAACSGGKVASSHVLQAMGATDDAAASAIRISTGWATTAADIDRFVEAWTAMAARLTAPAATAVAA